MKKAIAFLIAATFVFTACNQYGKKVAINSHSEVYYKGDSITKADAEKLGNFLLQQGFFNTTDDRSVQISKDSGAYVIRLVVDMDRVNENKDKILTSFKAWQYIIAQHVFPDAETKLILTDEHFTDFLSVGELTTAEKEQLQQEIDKASEPDTLDNIQHRSIAPPLLDTMISDSINHL